MLNLTFPVLLLAFAGAVFAADPQTNELKDGGKIVIEEKGTMIHQRHLENDHRARHAQSGSLGASGTLFLWSNARSLTLGESA